ncbi:MAG TPA: endopeptidase La [Nitrospinae bacterium]|nr:endopeptidase La [Nitrospinota bacterium]HBA26839.1 endopeptidase La [Nitrospinota bacterium]
MKSSTDPLYTVIPLQIPILPIKDTVIFPLMISPLFFPRAKDKMAIEDAMKGDHLAGVIVQKDKHVENPSSKDLYSIGTAVKILQIVKLEDGGVKILVEGIGRIKVINYIKEEPYPIAEIEELREFYEKNSFTDALIQSINTIFKTVVAVGRPLPNDVMAMIEKIDNPARLADLICVYLSLDVVEQQKILETIDPLERLSRVFIYLNKEVQMLQIREKIQSEVAKELSKTQREYLLKQQLKTIQKELGEEDPYMAEMNELRKKVEETPMPEKVKDIANKELGRLEKMNQASAEYTVSRTYIDYLITVPWEKKTEDNLDINRAATILDEDHYNLKKVKERVLEYLAVRRLKDKEKMKGPILCFVGPPGVGKTSLGKSIARALERKFIRISLGGMRDEAEIRGHRRTYVGALPGRIIQEIRRAEVCNPVFMLDEVDKIGQDFRGDPAAALLEVLDPEQNFSFSDHYMDVPYDLSNVMFITTANILDPVPPALKDRMEVIELPGYTEEEKEKIAFQYLIPRQIDANGLKNYSIEFTSEAIYEIIREYTREAGLRNLEREIASICRKIAKDIAQEKPVRNKIIPEVVEELLGPRKFFLDVAEEKDRIGVATGLAWTETGGDIIFVEATKMKGRKELILTGSLGEVMKESAQAALSYIRSHVKELNIPENFYDKFDIHVHVPSGAIPKDGPSAGITIATAIVSLLTGKPAKKDLAMTGELTLTGRVLPIGGVKEKVLAARRAGVKGIIMPKKNDKDLEDIPEYILNEMKFVFVEGIEDVLKEALKDSH